MGCGVLGLLTTFCRVEVREASARCSSCSTRAVSSPSWAGSSLSLCSPSEEDGVRVKLTGL